jgi:hypothetical protein
MKSLIEEDETQLDLLPAIDVLDIIQATADFQLVKQGSFLSLLLNRCSFQFFTKNCHCHCTIYPPLSKNFSLAFKQSCG